MIHFIGVYDYTVILTYISLISSVFGMTQAIHGDYKTAIFCLAFSGACDAFDGRIARTKKNRTEDEKNFGIQLDSLCDVICFGIFPALICYLLGVRGVIGLTCIFFYCICAVIRLAFFNVLEGNRQQSEEGANKGYRGLPVTSVALLLPLTFWLQFLLSESEFLKVLYVFLVAVGFLFILDISVPKPSLKTVLLLIGIGAITVGAILMYTKYHLPALRINRIVLLRALRMKQKTNDIQEKIIDFLYNTAAGRLILKPLISPSVSKLGGIFLSSGYSRFLIKPFIKHNHIDMSQFQKENYHSYNDFFSRRIRPEARPVDVTPNHLTSPCDCKLTALPITEDSRFSLKHTEYTITSLLRNKKLADEYHGGTALIFRLTVDDYHRYCYALSGKKSRNVRIPGVLHTVNPIANDIYPIYKENTREYCVLRNPEFGDVVVMEVGALLVGKIVNHQPEKARVSRGQEKGYFQFGGSTIVMLFKKDMVTMKDEIIENSRNGIETVVRYGEWIGER